MGLGEMGWFLSLTVAPTVPRGMASTPTRNEEKMGSWMPQPAASLGEAATSLGGGLVSRGGLGE